jgi:uncharacterized membrane protein HdeD (DUF308 family)
MSLSDLCGRPCPIPKYNLLQRKIMTKPNKGKDKTGMYNISRKMAPFQHYQYYFVAAAVATAIAGIVHLYMPFSHPMLIRLSPMAIFFLGSGIAQIFWILPIIKRWGRPWYYVGLGEI